MPELSVGKIDGHGGTTTAIGANYGSIMMTTGRGGKQLFAGVPALVHRLVGREQPLADLRAELCRRDGVAAISAIDGLPGVGKTALAIALTCDSEASAYFQGGVLWAGLGPSADVDSILAIWGTALGTDVSLVKSTAERVKLVSFALQERVGDKPVLLVIDDAWRWEHAAPFREINSRASAHLLTTRNAEIARKFAGAAMKLDTLSHSGAETFLRERCPDAHTVDPEGLRDLAHAVGGLPLALSLMAGRLNAEPGMRRWLRETIEELRNVEARLELESSETRPGLEGMSNTLRAIVELSVTSLPSKVRKAFAALGAFAPRPVDFGRDAALAVIGKGGSDGTLKRLILSGLLDIAGEERFALHQVLGAVAESRLGSDIGPRQRHEIFYLRFANADRRNWRRIEPELEQFRRAWGWLSTGAGRHEDVILYCHALEPFFMRRGPWLEYQCWVECGLRASRTLGRTGDEALLLNIIGMIYDRLHEVGRALEVWKEALPLFRSTGDIAGEAYAINNIGVAVGASGDQVRAQEHYEKALILFHAAGNLSGEASTLNNLGASYDAIDEKVLALEQFEKALPLARAGGDRSVEALALLNVGGIISAFGEKARALKCYKECLEIARAIGDRSLEIQTLFKLAMLREEQGETDDAIASLERLVELDEVFQDPKLAWYRVRLDRLREKQRSLARLTISSPRVRIRSLMPILLIAAVVVMVWLLHAYTR